MGDRQTGLYRRTALFVDFENVYIGLRSSSPEAAQLFATDPARWVRWMEQDLGPFLVEDEECPRALLRRICYLDPGRSGRYRPYFTRAGFRVVDCPALTGMGKNSADIHMVLDIVDTLDHPTRFDEFIVLSTDADFTPVLLRLREHDRRTAMLVSGPTAAALQAACDFTIPDYMFVEEALGMATPGEPSVPSQGGGPISPGPTPMGPLTSGSVAPPQVPLPGAAFVRTTPAPRPAPEPVRTSEGWGSGPGQAAPAPVAPGEVRAQIEAAVRDFVAAASGPVDLASAAHHARRVVGRVASTSAWAGAGGFKQFVSTMQDETLVLDPAHPGWLRDPRRHEPVSGGPVRPDGVPEVAERVHRVVGVPLLSPAAYRVLFVSITEEGRSTPGRPQSQAELAIRDACLQRGQTVGRPSIHFVLLGLQYSNVAWMEPQRDADNLAGEFAANVLRLAANARMDLSEEERDQIHEWITGRHLA